MSKHRLPSHVKPLKYQLQIVPNLSEFTFTGSEKIQLKISKSTTELTLHSLDLQITSALWKAGKLEYKSVKIIFDKKSETVKFIFTKPISGNGILELEFSGLIIDGLQGFYRSKYVQNKQEKYLATTQLEVTDARRFFPCFDEPAHKAIFHVSVVVPKKLQVISNTIESQVLPHHDPHLKIVHFAATPKMSTYLLALIIGELEHVQTKSKRGVKIRIHTTVGKKSQTKFALDVTKRALDYLEDYIGIPYPLPVLDLIAIPDFSAGAMENWGAITFRETALLVDEQHTTFIGRQRVAEVIAHELVHQWFGNLVTMEWWTHLWLNESFATYMAYLVVDKLFPGWNFWTKFVLQEQSIALSKDALHTSQPIEVEVKLPSEISESFDPAIVYAKGASVIRMLAGYIGPEDFRTGLSYYLKKHSYKNTESVHLWDAFEKSSGKPVRKFMATWTKKIGYPVVDVEIKNVNNKSYLLTSQTKFNQLPKKTKSNQLWSVPLLPIFNPKSEQSLNYTLIKQSQKFTFPIQQELFKLNYLEESFFITNYSPSLLSKIFLELREQNISSIERLAIVRNAFLLAKSGHIPTDVYLEMLSYLNNETSYIVWSQVANDLYQLGQLTFATKATVSFANFQKQIFSKLIEHKEIGFKPRSSESHNHKTLRALAFMESGLAGYKPSIKQAKRLFMIKKSGKNIEADLRLSVYCIIAKWGSQAAYIQLLKIYRETSLAQEAQQVLLALTYLGNSNLQTKALKLFFSTEVRDQDRTMVLGQALNNPSLKNQAWQAVQSNWPMLEKKFGANKGLGRIISGASSFNSTKELQAFTQFAKTHNLSTAKQSTAQTKEKIQIKVAWKARDLELITRYLKQYSKAKK